jgi:hypothetical protein
MQTGFSVSLRAAVVALIMVGIFDIIIYIQLRDAWKKIKQKQGPMLYNTFGFVTCVILLFCSTIMLLAFLF